MESNLQSSPQDNTDAKNAFRKPSSDAAHRNYRRRSPADGLPSLDGSPKRERSPSPNSVREDSVRVSDHYTRKDDGRDSDNGKNHHGRNIDSLKHSDRQSSRSSQGHYRNEDHIRHDKYADEDRYRERLSSRSGHGSRGDHVREGSDNRSKDYGRTVDKYCRDKYDRSDYRSKEKDRETSSLEHQKYKGRDTSYDRSGYGRRHAPLDEVERERRTRDSDVRDESRDSHRSSRDYRSDRAAPYSESKTSRDDSGSRKDSGKYRQKDSSESEQKEPDGKKISFDENKKYDFENSRDKDKNTRKVGEQIRNEDKESSAKKPKFGFDKEDKYDESQTSSSKHTKESNVELPKASGSEGISDLNSAKVAAMKAAELVNKNLVGVGCLTTDQKKKLLWGNKKNTTVEESGHRWDTALFSDKERQEKFNKLMSLRLHWCLWPLVGCERRTQGGAKIRRPTCREAEGTTPDGSRETVYCRSPPKRWPYSWIRSLNIHWGFFSSFDMPNVEFYTSMLWMILLIVHLKHIGEYALVSDTWSLGSWWDFLVRLKLVKVAEILVVVSRVLLSSSYISGLDSLDPTSGVLFDDDLKNIYICEVC